jgi:hypothetical protein
MKFTHIQLQFLLGTYNDNFTSEETFVGAAVEIYFFKDVDTLFLNGDKM